MCEPFGHWPVWVLGSQCCLAVEVGQVGLWRCVLGAGGFPNLLIQKAIDKMQMMQLSK